jgi:uncharacterized protein with HEPN domain
MPKKSDQLFLIHILDSIARIELYLNEVDKFIFDKDTLVQDGVIRQLEVIGEAVKNLSDELKDSFPHLPWQDMAGMRDKLIHHYFGVDIDLVWETAHRDLPVLTVEIEKMMKTVD